MRPRNTIALASTVLVLSMPWTHAFSADADRSDSVVTSFGAAVSADVMDAQRGRAVITVMDVDGKLYDTVATHNVTGNNTIGGGAFAQSNGFSTTIQNSGNNVLIQNATILQLDVR